MPKHLKTAMAVSFVLLLISTGLASVTLWNTVYREEARTDLPVYYGVPAFSLTDSRGQRFSREDVEGKVWVAEFFFTSCPGICPVMMTQMARLAEAYEDEPGVQFVGFSVDPETDTPERMAAYLDRFGGDPERWHLLTGPLETIQMLSEDGFKLSSLDSPAQHSGRFVLVDKNGRIRGFYDGTDPAEVDVLRGDIARLL